MTPTSAPDLPEDGYTVTGAERLDDGRLAIYVDMPAVIIGSKIYTRPQSEASALATPVPVGWRPIETAPEGKDILVYCRETGECFVVFWALQMETKQGDWVIARANDGTCFICKNPTHWQPLPAPPHTEERG